MRVPLGHIASEEATLTYKCGLGGGAGGEPGGVRINEDISI